ncbi:hypothetical protein LCGC14_1554160, partial [marine sediment metagenome]
VGEFIDKISQEHLMDLSDPTKHRWGRAIPQTADEVVDITDDIQATLNNVSNRKTLITQGMAHLEYDIESDEDEVDGKIVFVSEFDIRFINNFQNTG